MPWSATNDEVPGDAFCFAVASSGERSSEAFILAGKRADRKYESPPGDATRAQELRPLSDVNHPVGSDVRR